MSEQTRQALEAYIQKIIALADKTTDFAADQFPLLVQEWLRWYAAESILFIVVSIPFVIAPVVIRRRYLRSQSEPSDDDVFGSAVLAFFATVIPFLAFTNNLWALVKVTVAPRVVLVQEFVNLVKGVTP